MKSIKRFLPTVLWCSVALFGLTMVSTGVSANANNVNQRDPQVTAVKSKPNFYNQRRKGTGRVYQTRYQFTKDLNDNHGRKASDLYNKKINYNRIAKTPRGTFLKTRKGWLNQKAFNQFLMTYKVRHFNYRMRVIHNGNLYNLPAHINNARKVATTRQLGLLRKWVNVNGVANTNTVAGYYRFGFQNQNFWIPGQDLAFDLNSVRGRNHRLERALSYGERLIGHSKYNEKTRHYDCSSFVNHVYARVGRYLGSTTYSQIYSGRRANPRHLKRGDVIFFNTRYSTDAYKHKISGKDSHVAIYLGNGLILQDSPDTDNGGVDVTSLRDPMWNSDSKYMEVHKFNGIARRIL